MSSIKMMNCNWSGFTMVAQAICMEGVFMDDSTICLPDGRILAELVDMRLLWGKHVWQKELTDRLMPPRLN
jgi:hypothetical protein